MAEVDRLFHYALFLCSHHPFKEIISLLEYNVDPDRRVFRSFPFSLPSGWNRSLEKFSSFLLTLWSQHFSSLQDLGNYSQTFVNNFQNILDVNDLHVNKCFHGVWGVELVLADIDSFEFVPLIDFLPHLANWSEALSPLSLIESELLSTHSLELLELVEHIC